MGKYLHNVQGTMGPKGIWMQSCFDESKSKKKLQGSIKGDHWVPSRRSTQPLRCRYIYTYIYKPDPGNYIHLYISGQGIG